MHHNIHHLILYKKKHQRTNRTHKKTIDIKKVTAFVIPYSCWLGPVTHTHTTMIYGEVATCFYWFNSIFCNIFDVFSCYITSWKLAWQKIYQVSGKVMFWWVFKWFFAFEYCLSNFLLVRNQYQRYSSSGPLENLLN